MKKYILFSLLLGITLLSCENKERDFPDFDYSTVYFAYQYPVRTITLGEDIFNTDLDNEHKCQIMATWGGGYTNRKDVAIDVVVDATIVNNLAYRSNNKDVVAMPEAYYVLSSDKINIPKGSISGGVEVKLTDAFFADPLSLEINYVIPLVMTNVSGADSILVGEASVDNPVRTNQDDWEVAPKDYILYAVKYINTWDGFYLRRGVDEVTRNGSTDTEVRRQENVEDDAIYKLNTKSLTKLELPVTYTTSKGLHATVPVILNFNENTCSVVSEADTIEVNNDIKLVNITASGSGEFVKEGEKKSWGSKDRDALYLDYTVSFDVEAKNPAENETLSYATKDTLVMRDRGVRMETFEVVRK